MQHALTHLSATTRARVRGEFLDWASEHGYRAMVDWGHVLAAPIRPQIELSDPFASRSSDVAVLQAELSSRGDL